MNWKQYLSRLKNTGVVVGIVGYIIVILVNVGIEVDNAAVMNVVNAICSIMVMLGIMNNSDTNGVDLPTTNPNVNKLPEDSITNDEPPQE